MVWAGPGLLAVITGDLSVRFWDLDTGESYLLDVEPVNSAPSAADSSAGASNLPTEVFTSLSFCSQKGKSFCLLMSSSLFFKVYRNVAWCSYKLSDLFDPCTDQ
jgi:hypothetical protein